MTEREKKRPRQEHTQKQLRFVHVTKCAGTSIEDISNRKWGRYDTDYRDAVSDIYCKDSAWWHVPLLFTKPKYILKDLLKRYDYFTVVRNPYTRVISEYFCQWGGPKVKAKTAAEFNAWIYKRLSQVEEELEAFTNGALQEMGVCTDVENPVKGVTLKSSASLIGHWTPQFLYVLDTEGIEKLLAISRHTATHTDQTTGEMTKELQTTNNNVESEKLKKQDPLSDYSHLWNICRKENVLRFESLTSEFDALAKRYGLSAEISLLKSGPNAPSAALDGDSKDAKSTVNVFNGAVHMLRHDELKTFNVHDLSVENVALIQRIYVQDFAFFGYSTDLPIVKPVAAVSSSQNVSVSSRGQLDTSSLSDTSSAVHKAVHEPAADSSLGKRSFQESSIPSTASAKSVGSKQMNTASMPTDRATNTSLANASMSELIAQLQRRKAQTTATPSMQTSRN